MISKSFKYLSFIFVLTIFLGFTQSAYSQGTGGESSEEPKQVCIQDGTFRFLCDRNIVAANGTVVSAGGELENLLNNVKADELTNVQTLSILTIFVSATDDGLKILNVFISPDIGNCAPVVEGDQEFICVIANFVMGQSATLRVDVLVSETDSDDKDEAKTIRYEFEAPEFGGVLETFQNILIFGQNSSCTLAPEGTRGKGSLGALAAIPGVVFLRRLARRLRSKKNK